MEPPAPPEQTVPDTVPDDRSALIASRARWLSCYARDMQRYDRDTALVVVDVQNDFADPAGGLSVAGGAASCPVINARSRTAPAAGALVVATQDWHPATTPHFAKDGGDLAGPLRRRTRGARSSTRP